MTSPLDGRIRLAAEQAVASAMGGGVPQDGVSLQQQITDLHEHLHLAVTTMKRLEERIDTLEAAAASAPKRAARKTTGE